MNIETSAGEKEAEAKPTATAPEKIKEVHYHHYHDRPRHFNFGRLFLGLVVLFAGLAFLARSLDLVEFDFHFNWNQAIAVLIIIVGLSLLSFRGWAGGLIGALIVLVLAAIMLILILRPANLPWPMKVGGNWLWPEINRAQSETVLVNLSPNAQDAEINIDLGLGELILAGGASDLINGTFTSNFSTLTQTARLSENRIAVDFKTVGHWQNLLGNHTNQLDLRLNSSLPTNLNIKSGAANLELDLADVAVSQLTLDLGVSSLDLRLGDKTDDIKADIVAGASAIKIKLPRGSGVKIATKAGLSEKNFSGFNTIDDNTYESENFQTAARTIVINFDVGVSSIEVSWE
jgi:hypothetical protein